jgi:hypothetical protein
VPERLSYCPGCKHDVVFEVQGETRRCPNCSFAYSVTGAKKVSAFDTLGKIFHGLMMAILVIGGIIGLTVGVFFAGCFFRMW